MSSHIHHAVIAGTEPLDRWIRRVHSPFADAMNREHDRIGTMFVRGPSAFIVPPDRVANLLAYIHNNPVRARVVGTAADSDWTSHRAYLGLEQAPRWLHVSEGLERAGFGSAIDFDAWVRLEPCDPTRERSRKCAPKEAADLWPSWTANTHPSVEPREVIGATALAAKLSVEGLRSRRRGHAQSLARRAVVRCADQLGISGVAVARALGISQQRVSAILTAADETEELRVLVAGVMERLRASAVHAVVVK